MVEWWWKGGGRVLALWWNGGGSRDGIVENEGVLVAIIIFSRNDHNKQAGHKERRWLIG